MTCCLSLDFWQQARHRSFRNLYVERAREHGDFGWRRAIDHAIGLNLYSFRRADPQRFCPAVNDLRGKNPSPLADRESVPDIFAFTKICIDYNIQPAIVHKDFWRYIQMRAVIRGIADRDLNGPVSARSLAIESKAHLGRLEAKQDSQAVDHAPERREEARTFHLFRGGEKR